MLVLNPQDQATPPTANKRILFSDMTSILCFYSYTLQCYKVSYRLTKTGSELLIPETFKLHTIFNQTAVKFSYDMNIARPMRLRTLVKVVNDSIFLIPVATS